VKAVGARLPRYDGIGHVTGRTTFVDDVRVGRTLWAKALRSPHHRAGIGRLDTSKAEAMKGVFAVVTHADVPKNVYGHLEGLGVPADEPLLAEVFDVIERRYQETISLADVAAELSLTAGHLTTVVRRKTGRTVQQWLTERRMQQARLLLADTDLTVAAIGRRVGYPDASYFIKRFRADHEMTPAQWRHATP
jgi:AraC-like DNA-binding protein